MVRITNLTHRNGIHLGMILNAGLVSIIVEGFSKYDGLERVP